MRCGKFLLYVCTEVIDLLLTFVNILAECLGILTVTGLAGAVDVCQRTHHVVIRVFHAALGDVRHVAVSTGDAPLSVDSLHVKFITRVLGLEDLRLRKRIDVIVEADTVVVFFCRLTCQTLFLREVEIVSVFLFEIVFCVALCADQATHLLVRGFLHVFADACPRLIECRTSGTEIHRPCIVAVRATDGVHGLWSPVAPLGSIELVSTFFTHKAWNIRTLTGPACTGLYVFLSVDTGASCTQDLAQVFYGVPVPARCVVFPREGVSCP